MADSGDASRMSLAVAAALAAHAVVLALLAGRALVKLTIAPAPLLLTFVEAARQTAGPGEIAPGLRVATASAPAPTEPDAVPQPEPANIVTAPPEAQPKPEPAPKPVPPRAPKPPRAASPPREAAKPADALASANAGTAAGSQGLSASGANGADERSSAPVWAPAARVRYEELLFAWMDRHKQYPMIASRRGLEGSGSLRIRIDRDGRVVERHVEASTGEAMLDQAALDMVRRSSPFPRVPPDYTGTTFEFVAPIEYRLR